MMTQFAASKRARRDFEAKIARYKTARVKRTGEFVKLFHAEMQDGVAFFFGRCAGACFVWPETDLEEFCL